MFVYPFCFPHSAGFNPRTHTGCDAVGDVSNKRYCRFNPRTHTGCDAKAAVLRGAVRVSIHAPTRGATQGTELAGEGTMFQSTHPHGVRPIIALEKNDWFSFNPRTHTGCDLLVVNPN